MLQRLSSYFDPQERRLVTQSIVIGAVVWLVVYALKTTVHEAEHFIIHFIETQPLIYLVPVLFGSLAAGALIVAALARYGSRTVHYRDGDGHIHELIDVEGDGLERAISLYYASEPTFENAILGSEGVDVRWQLPTFSLAVRKFLATLATLGSGGSGGLEASVTLIGESISAGLFKPRTETGRRLDGIRRWWRPSDPDDLQTAQLSGIAAAVATLLGAPFTAAFFATEVMYRRRPIIERLIYSLISAIVAFFLNNVADAITGADNFSRFAITRIFDVSEQFPDGLPVPPVNDWRYLVVLALMSLVVALVSIEFARLRARIDHWFHYKHKNIWLRHLTGAAITGGIALFVYALLQTAAFYEILGISESEAEHALSLVLGTGEGVILDAMTGHVILVVAVIALISKMFATLSTIGSGGSAGLLVPSLFFGTMVATVFSQLPAMIGLGPEWTFAPVLLIAPAMTASLVAIVNVPLAGILFAVEVFSGQYMLPALVVLVVTSIFAYNNSIYRTQREKYSERQILPGYSVRRVPVPLKWDAKSLIDLNLRQKFDVNVIGWIEHESDDGLPHVRLSADAHRPLNAGDILVVLGNDESVRGLVDVINDDSDLSSSAAPVSQSDKPKSSAVTATAVTPPVAAPVGKPISDPVVPSAETKTRPDAPEIVVPETKEVAEAEVADVSAAEPPTETPSDGKDEDVAAEGDNAVEHKQQPGADDDSA